MSVISAVILAGGKGQRMNGMDKGLQLLQDKPLFMHVLERLQPQVRQISINANRNQAIYAQSGLFVFADELGDFQGPLSGMLTGLKLAQSQSDWVLFVPCDCPFLPLNLAEKLYQTVQHSDYLGSYVQDGEREHPTFCLLSPLLIPALSDYLAQGERRILHFLQKQNIVMVDFSEQKPAFTNINTLLELDNLD